MTGTYGIQVGTVALARRKTGVCDAGEVGVCYEVYDLGGRPGYSFIFEQGRFDGFSPEDMGLFLILTDVICASISDYQFVSVSRLCSDFDEGRFDEALALHQPGP